MNLYLLFTVVSGLRRVVWGPVEKIAVLPGCFTVQVGRVMHGMVLSPDPITQAILAFSLDAEVGARVGNKAMVEANLSAARFLCVIQDKRPLDRVHALTAWAFNHTENGYEDICDTFFRLAIKEFKDGL